MQGPNVKNTGLNISGQDFRQVYILLLLATLEKEIENDLQILTSLYSLLPHLSVLEAQLEGHSILIDGLHHNEQGLFHIRLDIIGNVHEVTERNAKQNVRRKQPIRMLVT